MDMFLTLNHRTKKHNTPRTKKHNTPSIRKVECNNLNCQKIK